MSDLTHENEHVANEIRKSGFPLEIEVAEVLERHGWEVTPSLFYHDLDDDEFKEMDLVARKRAANAFSSDLSRSRTYPYNVTMELVIECKKREGITWVFFPRLRRPDDLDYGGTGFVAAVSFQIARVSSLLPSHPMLKVPRGVGLHELADGALTWPPFQSS